MNILLTNDDGYFCEGIKALALTLSKKHKVIVVAPESEHSGCGHSFSMFKKLHARKVDVCDGVDAYAINGTPVDCVRVALKKICDDFPIDLVVSGINTVLNLGTDIIYSGTFNSALEGTVLGYPSIAVSTRCKDSYYFDVAEHFCEHLEDFCVSNLRKATLNLNYPYNHKESFSEVKVSTLGVMHYDDYYVEVDSEEEGQSYMLMGTPKEYPDNTPDCDVVLTQQGYITATPVVIHSACVNGIAELKERLKK